MSHVISACQKPNQASSIKRRSQPAASAKKRASTKANARVGKQKPCFLVYLYEDHYKSKGHVLLRAFARRAAAIKFAKSLSTEYKPEDWGVKRDPEELKEALQFAAGEPEHCVHGTEFEAGLVARSTELRKAGCPIRFTLGNDRIAVDKVRAGYVE